MVSRVPLLIEATSYNADYLATKAEKLGHLLLRTYLATVAIQWQDGVPSVRDRYERLEKIRHLAHEQDLLLQEEARSLATALFDQSALTFHLGFDQANLADTTWYQQPEHPYVKAIGQILDSLATWDSVQQLEFMISPGSDPLLSLQVQLDRQIFQLAVKPSTVLADLQTQRIYVFSSHPSE